MPTKIPFFPNFDHEAAEHGYAVLLARFPHIEPITEIVQGDTQNTRAMQDGRREEIVRLNAANAEDSRHFGAIQKDLREGALVTDADEKKLARLKRQIAARTQRMNELYATTDEPIFHLNKLAAFFAGVQDYHQFERVELKVTDDPERAAKELLKNAEARADLQRQIRELDIGPLPLAAALAKAQGQIQRFAREGTPNTSAAFRMPKGLAGRRQQGEIRFKERVQHGTTEVFEIDPVALVFWACEDVILQKTESMIRAESQLHGSPIPWDERQPIIADLRAKLRELEYREQALIQVCESDPKSTVRRHPDSDPITVLMLRRLPDAASTKVAKSEAVEADAFPPGLRDGSQKRIGNRKK